MCFDLFLFRIKAGGSILELYVLKIVFFLGWIIHWKYDDVPYMIVLGDLFLCIKLNFRFYDCEEKSTPIL